MAVSVRPVTEEPLGIVISRGGGEDPQPAFSAYVWAEEEKKIVAGKGRTAGN